MNCMKCNHGHVEKDWMGSRYIWCDLHNGRGMTYFVQDWFRERVCDYENDDDAPFLLDEIKRLGDPFDIRGVTKKQKRNRKTHRK